MPAFSPTIATASGTELPVPRPFGTAATDLDIDFGGRDRPALVTAVLASCCGDDTLYRTKREEAAWNLPVGARILRLLRIVELTIARDIVTVGSTCPQRDCRQPFELALPLPTIAEAASSGTGGFLEPRLVKFPLTRAAEVALRLPTGRDQAAWRAQQFGNADDALIAIVRSLATDPAALPAALGADELAPLAEAMEAADPLVTFTVNTTCPHCQCAAAVAVDLEAVALQQLAEHRRSLLRDVHQLATGYGWTEAEVLAIPPLRRAEYKRLIAAEEKSFP